MNDRRSELGQHGVAVDDVVEGAFCVGLVSLRAPARASGRLTQPIGWQAVLGIALALLAALWARRMPPRVTR